VKLPGRHVTQQFSQSDVTQHDAGHRQSAVAVGVRLQLVKSAAAGVDAERGQVDYIELDVVGGVSARGGNGDTHHDPLRAVKPRKGLEPRSMSDVFLEG
jgi:hypothetical protein